MNNEINSESGENFEPDNFTSNTYDGIDSIGVFKLANDISSPNYTTKIGSFTTSTTQLTTQFDELTDKITKISNDYLSLSKKLNDFMISWNVDSVGTSKKIELLRGQMLSNNKMLENRIQTNNKSIVDYINDVNKNYSTMIEQLTFDTQSLYLNSKLNELEHNKQVEILEWYVISLNSSPWYKKITSNQKRKIYESSKKLIESKYEDSIKKMKEKINAHTPQNFHAALQLIQKKAQNKSNEEK